MELERQAGKKTIPIDCSPRLFDALIKVSADLKEPLYVVGGTVRDLLLGIVPRDLDLSAAGSAHGIVRALQSELNGGAIVDLSGPEDEAARFVWHGEQVDVSSFRSGTISIEADLRLRDFTVNAIALGLEQLVGDFTAHLIDPTGGFEDLKNKNVVQLPGAFDSDPVRILRGYRLFAQNGFILAAGVRTEVQEKGGLLKRVAAERIGYEMKLIFDSTRTSETLALMAEDKLLTHLLPELWSSRGVEQPEFHHLDVFEHSFTALQMIEKIGNDPGTYYPKHEELINEYLKVDGRRRCLKWAALMHDIGKPSTKKTLKEKNDRVTFHRHDEIGRQMFMEFAEQARWGNNDSERVAALIGMHMHPFHLCNVHREEQLSRRAALKLSNRAGDDLVGLFLLAMADSLASEGEKKPEDMEGELTELFNLVRKIYDENIAPVQQGPRLITGKDLIERFGLEPGPQFAVLLGELEAARVEDSVKNRDDALVWVENYLKSECH